MDSGDAITIQMDTPVADPKPDSKNPSEFKNTAYISRSA